MCSVADVCQQFQTITKRMFPTQFVRQICENSHEYEDLCKMESLLRNFGTQIPSLSLNAYSFGQHLDHSISKIKLNKNAALLMLITYCSGPDCKLESLNLSRFDIGRCWYSGLWPIFSRLKYLTLDRRSRINELLGICNELIQLKLIDVDSMKIEELLKMKTFRNLEVLCLCGNSEDIYHILNHIRIHPSLKLLKISDFPLVDIYTLDLPIFNEISFKFPNLEYLLFHSHLHLDKNDRVKNQLTAALDQMTNLKKISLLRSRLDDKLIKCFAKSKATIEWLL